MSEPRFFTIDQARQALPEVRRIAEGIVRLHQELGRLSPADLPELCKRNAMVSRAYFRCLQTMASLERRLSEMGVMLKDRQKGLVDFPALYGGRIVLLCWQVEEPDIGYWHDLESGIAGRRPVAELPAPTKPD